ncbi:MAG: hypothetical protein AB7U82_12500 [Blastocatellales bacterium]
MTRKILILLTVLLASVAWGRWMQRQHAGQLFGANVAVDPSQLPAACRSNITMNSVVLNDSGATSETFLVTWVPPDLTCLAKAAVTVKVKRRDGSTAEKTEFVDAGQGIAGRQASVKIFGSRSDNRSVEATATVILNGLQGVVVNKTVNF